MKLVVLTQYFPPEIGAPQARLSSLAAEIVRHGHEVTVLTAMPNYPAGRIHEGYGGIFRRERWNGISVLRAFIYPTQRADYLRRLANYFSFVLSSAAVGIVALPRADYILVESPPLFLGLSGILLARLKGARLIFNVSDLWPDTAVRLGMLRRDGVAHRLSSWLEALCYRNARIVTGQTRGIVADIARRFPTCRTYHLSNGAETARFGPERATAEARDLIGRRDHCTVLYAGLHGLAQGLDQLLAAAESLRDENIQFTLVGEGPDKQRLVERAGTRGLHRVRFLDSRPAAEIPPLLASADIVVVPLRAGFGDAVPSKLYEAMASGRAVIAISDGEAADVVREHSAGIAVPPDDTAALASAIRTLRADPALRAQLGRNGRRAVLERFDRTGIAARFIELLEGDGRSEIPTGAVTRYSHA